MLEGSQPDSTPPSAGTEPAESSEPKQGEDESAVKEPQTVEEVEAIWKNRVSGKDRAHAAESATLREQIADLNRRLATKAETDMEDASDAEQWKSKYDAEKQRADDAERQRALDVRSVKYAAAAENLDEATLASMDEGKLAALNARLQGDEAPPPSPMDPNAAPRRSSAPPAPREKSVEELEADLERYGPEYAASLREG